MQPYRPQGFKSLVWSIISGGLPNSTLQYHQPAAGFLGGIDGHGAKMYGELGGPGLENTSCSRAHRRRGLVTEPWDPSADISALLRRNNQRKIRQGKIALSPPEEPEIRSWRCCNADPKRLGEKESQETSLEVSTAEVLPHKLRSTRLDQAKGSTPINHCSKCRQTLQSSTSSRPHLNGLISPSLSLWLAASPSQSCRWCHSLNAQDCC